MLHGLKFIIQLMPTLVWKRRTKSGTATAREAAVPDTVASAAAAVPESAVSAASAFPSPVGSSGVALPAFRFADEVSTKKRKMAEHQQAAVDDLAQTKHSPSSNRDLPRGVQKTPTGKFSSSIGWGGKSRRIGTFATPEQASAAYMSLRKLSVGGADEARADAIFKAAQKKAVEEVGGIIPKAKKTKPKATSKRDLPPGVYSLPSGKYRARTLWGGKARHIGTFDTPEQASAAFISVRKDYANLSAVGAAEGMNDAFDAAQREALEAVGGTLPKKMKTSSERGLPTGVYKARSGKLTSMISWVGKQRYIGSFDTPEQASAAFMSAKKALDDAELSVFGADDKVDRDAVFDAAKKKALETVQAMKQSDKYGDEHLV